MDPIFYAAPTVLTQLPPTVALETLPRDLPRLCALVQGVLLHVYWAERYGVAGAMARFDEANLRAASERIAGALRLDPAPITVARPPERRTLGTCRDFAVLLVAVLRAQGTPARARCGFADYFEPEKWVDHWVAEVWDGGRWRRVDAQLDRFQRDALGIDFDPIDLPEGRFLSGGEAWALCRSGGADPTSFGIFDLNGLWFIAGDLVRDVAALRKIELLPWDCWGLADIGPADTLDDDALALLDRTAGAGDDAEALNAVYADPRLRVPDVIVSYVLGQPKTVRLPEGIA